MSGLVCVIWVLTTMSVTLYKRGVPAQVWGLTTYDVRINDAGASYIILTGSLTRNVSSPMKEKSPRLGVGTDNLWCQDPGSDVR